MHIKKGTVYIATISILCTVLLLIFSFMVIRAIGKTHLRKKADFPSAPIHYQNKRYTYNEDIFTFLIMGIDQGKELYELWAAKAPDTGNGQADALFLAVLDTRNKCLKVININRNTMTKIYHCDDVTGSIPTFSAQIALQHAYGNESHIGCEYQVKVVRELFYNLPIHGYAAISIDAVPMINDMVGGVDVDVSEDVNVPEDLSPQDISFAAGSHVHLMGESAYWFVKYRDINQFASADLRSERHSRYFRGFVEAAKQSLQKNPFLAVQIYEQLTPKMDTDISTAELLYLAPILGQCRFDEDAFYQIPGETVMGDTYEEFYPDEDALIALILDIFYEEEK